MGVQLESSSVDNRGALSPGQLRGARRSMDVLAPLVAGWLPLALGPPLPTQGRAAWHGACKWNMSL